MRKIVSLLHLSLDGIAKGPNGELDWIAYDSDLEQYAHALHARTDAVIWGRGTYEIMVGYWPTIPGNPDSTVYEREHADWLEAATKIVVSRTLARVAWGDAQNTLLIKANIAEEIAKIKRQPGKDIWFLGSPTLLQTFMQLDLIDEYWFTISPTVLGRGTSVFSGVNRAFGLKLLDMKAFPSGAIAVQYAPERT